jgi:hypothetical protein
VREGRPQTQLQRRAAARPPPVAAARARCPLWGVRDINQRFIGPWSVRGRIPGRLTLAEAVLAISRASSALSAFHFRLIDTFFGIDAFCNGQGGHQAQDEQRAASHSRRGVNRDRLGGLYAGQRDLADRKLRSEGIGSAELALGDAARCRCRARPANAHLSAREPCASRCPSKARGDHAMVVAKATVSGASGTEPPARGRHNASQIKGLAADTGGPTLARRPFRSSTGPAGTLPPPS